MDPDWIGSMLCSFGIHDTVMMKEELEYSLNNTIDKDSVLDDELIYINPGYQCMRCGTIWYDRKEYVNEELDMSRRGFEDEVTHWREYER